MLTQAPSGQQGFSLIELVVTLSILALLGFAILPSMGSWIRNVNVRSTAESAMTGLQKARMEALRRNRVVTFWLVSPAKLDSTCALSSSVGSWVVSIDDPSGKCDVAPSPTDDPRIVEISSASSTSTYTLSALARDGSTAATSVSFNGYGQVLQTGTPIATIDVSPSETGSGARNLRVAVSVAGGIRMCDRDVSSPDPRAC